MGGFLTGFATGFLNQANQNYADTGKQQDALLAKQQALVDRVAADNDTMRKQANDIALKQNSYIGQYNIPEDMAYNLATDPSFDKMDPDKRADYVNRLKPVPGAFTPAQQAVGNKTIPGYYQDKGIFGGKVSIPPVTVPNSGSPYVPERQVYSVQPGLPDYKPLEQLFGHLDKTQLTPDAQDAYQRVVQAVATRQQPDPRDIATVSTGAANKANYDRALNNTTEMVSKGMIDPTDAEQMYQKLGGNANGSGIDWTKIKPTGKNNPIDDAKQKEISRLKTVYGLSDEDATGIAYGTKKVTESTTGETRIVDLVHNTSKIIQDPSAVPQSVRVEAYKQFQQTPNLVRQFDGVSGLFRDTPKAAGITGEMTDKWGGQVVNMLRFFNLNDMANSFNSATNVDKVQNARNALIAIKAEMAKPLTNDPRLPVYVRQQLDQIMADDSHHTVEQILDSMAMLKTYALANMLDNYKVAGYQLPQGLSAPAGSDALKQGVQQFQQNLTQYANLSGNNLKAVTAMAINMAHGNDPYDIKGIFGGIRQEVNGPTK